MKERCHHPPPTDEPSHARGRALPPRRPRYGPTVDGLRGVAPIFVQSRGSSSDLLSRYPSSDLVHLLTFCSAIAVLVVPQGLRMAPTAPLTAGLELSTPLVARRVR